jgi:predicted ATP-grasp superfamily ATP-dependent carboligase
MLKPKININLPYAIYIGLDTMPGLQASRILARKGIPVIGITGDPKDHGCLTNTCHKIVCTDKESEQLITTLIDIGKSLKQKAVLFTGQEKDVLIVSKHRDKLKNYYHFAFPEQSVVEMLIDKIEFYKYCQKENLPIPKTFFLNCGEDVERAASELHYPAILKPNYRSPKWVEHTTIKAFKVHNGDELKNNYEKYNRWGDGFIVQEWIEGSDSNHYTCNGYFNGDSELLVTFVSRKIRQWPPRVGQGCISVESKNDTVLNEAIKLFKQLNYKGLFYLDMKLDDRTGKYLIVEPNICRLTGRAPLAEASGVELAYTMYCDLAGLKVPENVVQHYGDVKWIHIRRDLQASYFFWKEKQLTLKDWWKSWQGKRTYAVFDWKDPAPFFGDLFRILKLYLNKNERKKRHYQDSL